MRTPIFEFVANDYVWFKVHEEKERDLEELQIQTNFDYETPLDADKSFLHIDVELNTAEASILVRSTYQFENEADNYDSIFNEDELMQVVDESLSSSIITLNANCEMHHVSDFKAIKTSIVSPEPIVEQMIHKYWKHRRTDDESNRYIAKTEMMVWEVDWDSRVVFRATFAALDEVLFRNPAFDHQHNREVFCKYVPFPKYISLRDRCLIIFEGELTLSILDSIFFFTCLNCAIQILLGDRCMILLEELESWGFDKDDQKIFFKYGTEMYEQFKLSTSETGANFPDLDVQHDWMNDIY